MMIADAQVHVWEAERPTDPWPAGGQEAAARHRPPLSPEALLEEMDAAGVERAVLVPPFFEGYRNGYAIQASRDHPERFRVMPRLDLRAADGPRRLEALLREPAVAGLRFVFVPAAGVVLNDGAADWLWPIAAEREVPVMLHVPGQLEEAGRLASTFPSLRLTIDHLGLSGGAKDGAIAAEIDDLVALHVHRNVCVKASTLPYYSSEPYPYPSLHPLLARVLDAFGPERVFWGSDLSRLPGSYAQLVALFREELPFLGGAALSAVMGESLCAWLEWPAHLDAGVPPPSGER